MKTPLKTEKKTRGTSIQQDRNPAISTLNLSPSVLFVILAKAGIQDFIQILDLTVISASAFYLI